MRTLLVLGCLVLAGCVSRQQLIARQNAADDNQCLRFGYTQGTPAFAQCRLALYQIHQRAASAAAARAQANSASMLGYSAALMQNSGPSALPSGSYQMPTQGITCDQVGYQTRCY